MQVMAPLTPLTSEEIYRGLTGERSVHLTDWPVLPAHVADSALVSAMDEARDAVSAALSLRKAEKLRVRQPLRSLTVAQTDPAALAPFRDLIAEEVNVKEVRVLDAADAGYEVTERLSRQPRAFDPEVRRLTSRLFAPSSGGVGAHRGRRRARRRVLLGGSPWCVEAGGGSFA